MVSAPNGNGHTPRIRERARRAAATSSINAQFVADSVQCEAREGRTRTQDPRIKVAQSNQTVDALQTELTEVHQAGTTAERIMRFMVMTAAR